MLLFYTFVFCNYQNLRIGITGGSCGLGLCISERLINLGASLTIFDIVDPPQPLQTKAVFIKLDLNNIQEIPESLDFDIFISNAAFFNGIKRFESCTSEEIIKLINVNVVAPVILYKNVACKLHVFINSVLSLKGFPNLALYCASKSFINTFNESIRQENGNTLIVYPGKMNTQMFEELRGNYMVDKDVAADKILKAIEREDEFLYMPWYFRYTGWLNVMCITMHDFVVNRISRRFALN